MILNKAVFFSCFFLLCDSMENGKARMESSHITGIGNTEPSAHKSNNQKIEVCVAGEAVCS